ncbi:TetR/AcrR family transcriptional regulator [Bacillus sp. CGMCC 1.16607]|uniref:TetR/AcrR family transcriptional regulator n=1 Tax=Bacillus sp. CGMCC 1.16607 TaxID=3351842 RepID=UPI00363BB975
MNDRKKHVVKMAHQLFIDKGFQATSIQDILDFSGISKGTFYNYFSSKNELLIAIFKSTYGTLEKKRNELLIGHDRSDIEIFIKQIELQMRSNRENKLISLFEEVIASNDAELKQFIELGKMKNIRWLYQRFIDIFGEDKKPYLLDCAIMFMGILRENLKFFHMAHGQNMNIGHVIRYTVRRLEKMVAGLADSGEQLINPELLIKWLPDKENCHHAFHKKVLQIVHDLKKALNQNNEQSKYVELLDFIVDELVDSKNPRVYLIESTILSLRAGQEIFGSTKLQKLDQLIDEYFSQIKSDE